MNLDAVLRVKADVQGQGEIDGLSRSFDKLNKQAAATGAGLGRMGQAAKGVGGLMSTLLPVGAIAGLTAFASKSINAADNLNDLSQRTGVAVESLSRFGAAAADSGSSIEGVAKGMGQLAKRVADTGKSGEAIRTTLQGMGISATDANGKIRSLDDLMLDIADRFSKMPDGAEKSALAMRLFGKAGTELIPMLNQGRAALEKYQATISGDMAKSADQFNDALNNIARSLSGPFNQAVTALLPSITQLANGLAGALQAFSKLPQPVQTLAVAIGGLAAAFIVLAPAINAIIALAGTLGGLGIGATIAGWAGAIGPAVAGIVAALGGLLAWVTGTLVPGLVAVFSGPIGWTVLAVAAVVAMVALFREPIGQFFTWLGQTVASALPGILQAMQSIFVQPFIDLWNNVLKGPVTAFFDWVKGVVEWGMKAAYAVAYQLWVQPWINIWNGLLRDPVTKMISWLQKTLSDIGAFFQKNVVAPIQKAWTTVTEFIPKALERARDGVKSMFDSVATAVKNVFRGVLQFIADRINTVTGLVNRLIDGFNSLPGNVDIPRIPTITVPQFAEGGVVNRPTLAMVGEGGEREYIIPESKMAAASANYLTGSRGAAVIAPANGSQAPAINITTGPVLEFNGERYVTMRDLERAVRSAATSSLNRLRTPSSRIALGLA